MFTTCSVHGNLLIGETRPNCPTQPPVVAVVLGLAIGRKSYGRRAPGGQPCFAGGTAAKARRPHTCQCTHSQRQFHAMNDTPSMYGYVPCRAMPVATPCQVPCHATAMNSRHDSCHDHTMAVARAVAMPCHISCHSICMPCQLSYHAICVPYQLP